MTEEKKYTPTAIFDMLEDIQLSLESLEEKMDNIHDLVNGKKQKDYGFSNYDDDDEDDEDDDEEDWEEAEEDDDDDEEDEVPKISLADEIQSDSDDIDWEDWYDDNIKIAKKKPKKITVGPYKSIWKKK